VREALPLENEMNCLELWVSVSLHFFCKDEDFENYFLNLGYAASF